MIESMESERILLNRLISDRDPDAFSIIMHRFIGLVYGTCRRVLRNETLAQDAAQETFLDLMKHSHSVRGSLGCWLHQVAFRRAVDLLRQNDARRKREESYATTALNYSSPWSEIEPLVDEVLAELPDEQRSIVTRHFLEGQTMMQIASVMGISQPSVSRRITAALETMRLKLRSRGVLIGLFTLAKIMPNALEAAPTTLLKTCGKIALFQAIGSSLSLKAPIATNAALMQCKCIAVACGVALICGFIVTSYTIFSGKSSDVETRNSHHPFKTTPPLHLNVSDNSTNTESILFSSFSDTGFANIIDNFSASSAPAKSIPTTSYGVYSAGRNPPPTEVKTRGNTPTLAQSQGDVSIVNKNPSASQFIGFHANASVNVVSDARVGFQSSMKTSFRSVQSVNSTGKAPHQILFNK